MKPKLFLHLGFPKTATTSIQEKFFDQHEEINCVGAITLEREREWKEFDGVEKRYNSSNGTYFFNDIVATESIFFDSIMSKYENIFSEYVTPDKVLVYSLEDFVTNHRNNFDIGLIADRLHKIFSRCFDVEVIFTIREQKSILPTYFQTLYTGSFNKFINEMLEDPEKKVLASLRYDLVAKYYANLFGKEKVHLLLFEELQQDRLKFIEKLSNILRISINYDLLEVNLDSNYPMKNKLKSFKNVSKDLDLKEFNDINFSKRNKNGEFSVSIQSLLSKLKQNSWFRDITIKNLLIKKIARYLSLVYIPFISFGLTSEQKIKIDKLYGQGNNNLMDDWDLDLIKFGYPVSKEGSNV